MIPGPNGTFTPFYFPSGRSSSPGGRGPYLSALLVAFLVVCAYATIFGVVVGEGWSYFFRGIIGGLPDVLKSEWYPTQCTFFSREQDVIQRDWKWVMEWIMIGLSFITIAVSFIAFVWASVEVMLTQQTSRWKEIDSYGIFLYTGGLLAFIFGMLAFLFHMWRVPYWC